MRMKKNRGQLIYTLLGYILMLVILVAIALIIGVGVYWFVNQGIRPSHDSMVKWTGLIVFTPVTFGFAVKQSKSHWRNKIFWATMTGMLIVHFTGFWIMSQLITHWSMIWFFVTCAVEGPLIVSVADWMARHFREPLK